MRKTFIYYRVLSWFTGIAAVIMITSGASSKSPYDERTFVMVLGFISLFICFSAGDWGDKEKAKIQAKQDKRGVK